jgi:hypothetical protein
MREGVRGEYPEEPLSLNMKFYEMGE